MLNCTDLECILHHHYYYAHLHQLQQPPIDNAFSTAAEDVEYGVKAQDNKTDSPQSSSHLEPPLDLLYTIGGLMIATALVGVIIILIAVTISKLRKREDNANDHQEPAVVQTATSPAITIILTTMLIMLTTTVTTTTTDIRNNGIVNPAASITVSEINGIVDGTIVTEGNDQFVWQFPPPYPPPLTPPPQYTLYNDQNTLVHGLEGDRSGFAKGIRKNLGRWRRLVKRKSDMDTCAIPPELKDQLKTIYVY
ncbi:LOW QUALITY PROTEIN: uncharacterized protein LOC123264522 [Cotesia glomerata]|uniref:LOW QUALITY PROTEIN: uncharacterized protein LOC123264522 n=1 Tax=Cotesia glomerata TaxID=32391 RepID=UPI001D02E2B9|nr:LOW QUALITY PROTEIN: uncharacterized protein LOC123264522 [Cotesia glomerata]